MSRFSLINLGCPKNTVDSECMLGSLAQAGLEFTPEPLDADICLVNTCGFLDAARQEAAEVFAELVAQREGQGRERPLLVALGCLVERAGGAGELADFCRRRMPAWGLRTIRVCRTFAASCWLAGAIQRQRLGTPAKHCLKLIWIG